MISPYPSNIKGTLWKLGICLLVGTPLDHIVSSRTMAWCAAGYNAVHPMSLFTLASAPYSNNNRTTATYPLVAAQCKALHPSSVFASTLAPRLKKRDPRTDSYSSGILIYRILIERVYCSLFTLLHVN